MATHELWYHTLQLAGYALVVVAQIIALTQK